MEATLRRCEAAVIGAGPAGLSAAITLAELGVDTIVLDEKPEAGGQLFKQIHKFFGSERHMTGLRGFEIGRQLLDRCRALDIPIALNTTVWGVFPDRSVGAVRDRTPVTIRPDAIIMATGAAENALAFPGWTLPGVMGAGAAQTLVNYYRVRPGRRALIVGAGNVGLIVAYQLLQAGIDVAAVVEGTDRVGGYMVHAAKVRRMGVPLFTRHTVVRADGDECVRQCAIAEVDGTFRPLPRTERVLDVDLICLAVGLSPAAELCRALGVAMTHVNELGGLLPLHDESLTTTAQNVHVAGDISGVEEASSAMEEGKLAAISVAVALGKMDGGAAEEASNQIRDNLRALRSGPFGAMVARRKREIHRRYRERCPTNVSRMCASRACST